MAEVQCPSTRSPWEATKTALGQLESLLDCRICKRKLHEPHTITSCGHHFCKVCVYNSFDNLQRSVCPECRLPAWRRDVATNHQLAAVLDLLAEVYQVIKEPCHTEGVAACSPSLKPNSLQRSSTANDAEKNVFRTPIVTRSIIERHIAAKLSSASASPASNTLLSDKDLMAFDASGHSHTNFLPNVKCVEAGNMFLGGGACPLASAVEEGGNESTVDEKPRIKRRRRAVDRLCITDKRQCRRPNGRVAAGFPYTPIVTKTRSFARLSYKDKMSRLGAAFKPGSSGAGVDGKHEPLHEQVSEAKGKPPMGPPATKLSDSLATEASFPGVRTRRVRATHPVEDRRSVVGGTVLRSSVLVKALKRNLKGETQLHTAAIKGDVEAVRKQLSCGVDPNVKDFAGWTPLHEACNHGHYDIVQELLSNGAFVNAPGYNNESPLHDAVIKDHVKVACLLLSHGANTELRNKQGGRPSDYATSQEMQALFAKPSLKNSAQAVTLKIRSPHASPQLNGGGPICVSIATSSLTGAEKDVVRKTAALLQAEVTNDVSQQTTHLVTSLHTQGCCRRTKKFLHAVARGIWIVSHSWIEQSFKDGCWADESSFEVKGAATLSNVYVTEAPRRARENRALLNPSLFDGFDFYFVGVTAPSATPSRDEVVGLIAAAGGRILSREPRIDPREEEEEKGSLTKQCPFHSALSDGLKEVTTFVLYDPCCIEENSKLLSKWRGHRCTVTVPIAWILDCLTHFELTPLPTL